MLRSLYSGISGMKVYQQKMDVIGNNIANVGTTAFKGSRAIFQDMLSQNVSDAQGASLNLGGINGNQVGLGVRLAGINTLMTTGLMQPTTSPLDVAIDGAGYFMVEKGPNIYSDNGILVDSSQGNHSIDGKSLAQSNATICYTRDGAFHKDADGNLLTTDGYRVMGYSLTNDNYTTSATATAPANLTVGNVTFGISPGEALNGYNFVIGPTATGTAVSAKVDTTAKTITISGDIASASILSDWKDAINSGLSGKGINQAVTVTTPASVSPTGLPAVTSPATLNGPIVGGTPVQSIDTSNNINFVDAKDNLYAYDNNLKSLKIPKTVHDVATNTDLQVTGYSIDKSGLIVATLEGGKQAAVGQIALASFNNPEGLKKLGKNLNEATPNSGTPTIKTGVNTHGADNSTGYGDQLSSTLEMSNVDLAEQFTDMITTTRAFEANGKIITNGDEILQTIINLKR
jgi:flagellar hook protein FlgE